MIIKDVNDLEVATKAVVNLTEAKTRMANAGLADLGLSNVIQKLVKMIDATIPA